MKKIIDSISLPVLIICYTGILLKNIVPLDFHYILGFFVGIITNVIQFNHIFKKNGK